MSATIQAEVFSTQRSGPEPRRYQGLEVLRLEKGRTQWSLEGKNHELREGDLFLVLPGQVFGGPDSSDGIPIRIQRMALHGPEFAEEDLAKALSKALGCKPSQARLLASSLQASHSPLVHASPSCSGLFEELAQIVDAETPQAEFHRQAICLHLLTLVMLALEEPVKVAAPNQSDAEARVSTFLAELEAECDEVWSLEAMAEAAGLKRSRFGEICRQLTGESPSTYLNRLRVRRSRALLRETDLSVTDIAFRCGFGSSQYFAKIFRRFQGHEPSHYRLLSRELRQGKGLRYLKGASPRIVAYANRAIGPGDFVIQGSLSLDRLGGTAASLEFCGDRFGFDGREGRFFLEGTQFDHTRLFSPSAEIIREGIPFHFELRCQKGKLQIRINDAEVANCAYQAPRLADKVGLRPLRNGIHILEFQVNGEPTVLEGSAPLNP